VLAEWVRKQQADRWGLDGYEQGNAVCPAAQYGTCLPDMSTGFWAVFGWHCSISTALSGDTYQPCIRSSQNVFVISAPQPPMHWV
jgi:hypothetical protein